MNINLHTWFSDRELKHCPIHFVHTKTPITDQSKQWVLEKLTGRFCLVNRNEVAFFMELTPSFEDPQEAVMYELTWG